MGESALDADALMHSILAVDDDPDIRRILVQVFTAKKYRVFEAENARNACEVLDSEPIGVALIDKNLPGERDGLGLLEEVRRRHPYTKSIVVTAHSTIESVIEAMSLGAFDYLTKPFKLDEIIRKVERAFEALSLDMEHDATTRNFSVLFETIPGVVWFATDRGVIRRINRSGAGLLGYNADELQGQPYGMLLAAQTRDPAVHWAFNERRTGDRVTRHQLVELRTAQGARRMFEVFSSGVYLSTRVGESQVRRFWGTVGVAYDVTERIRTQNLLQQAQKMEAVGQLAGGIAHDFNNILTAMIMELNLLQREVGHDKSRQTVDELLVSAERAASLTRQLLLFSRRQSMTMARHDANVVVVAVARFLERLLGEQITLAIKAHEEPLWFSGDAHMVEQVVTNLCINARDAMPAGGRLTVATRPVELEKDAIPRHSAADPGPFVCLEVSDTGCGIDPATLDHIFEPFFTTKKSGQGVGLGLATVHGIVARHKGFVEVRSQVGQGTTFSVYLPRAEAGGASEVIDQAAGVRGGSESILLVEDDAAVRRIAGRCLRHLGYRVTEAVDGVDALKVWEREEGCFDLLFTDMVMPAGISGLDLSGRLRKMKAGLRTIIASGYSAEIADEVNVAAAQGVIYVSKPYDVATLAAAVRECLDVKHP